MLAQKRSTWFVPAVPIITEETSGKASSFTSNMVASVFAMLYQLEPSAAPCKPGLPILHYGTVLSYGISNLVWDDLVPAVAPFAMACSVIASTASRAAYFSETWTVRRVVAGGLLRACQADCVVEGRLSLAKKKATSLPYNRIHLAYLSFRS